MYVPCKTLFERLMDVAEAGENNPAIKALNVLVECNSKGGCPQRMACCYELKAGFLSLGMTPPLECLEG